MESGVAGGRMNGGAADMGRELADLRSDPPHHSCHQSSTLSNSTVDFQSQLELLRNYGRSSIPLSIYTILARNSGAFNAYMSLSSSSLYGYRFYFSSIQGFTEVTRMRGAVVMSSRVCYSYFNLGYLSLFQLRNSSGYLLKKKIK
nr:hypothetical protein Iba_chr15dCG7260 [Ipomoea batatas]